MTALSQDDFLPAAVDRLKEDEIARERALNVASFIVEAPAGQEASHDDNELVEQRWLRPVEARPVMDRALRQLTTAEATADAQ